MAAVLQFQSDVRRTVRKSGVDGSSGDGEPMGQVIIFPGVRRERKDPDPSHRLMRYASEGGPVRPVEN
ncbi:hypothetical protein [Microbaculum marinum]|uniref:Uncharacterized protein n=1 Tax=Microbaculum marinum TaxID=1764581 RepID=A0AAW9RTB9_9HYPH